MGVTVSKYHRIAELLLLCSFSSPGRAGDYKSEKKKEKKNKERKIWSVLTVNDRKEENKVPSSYLDSLARTPSKMVTNYEHKKHCNYF